MNKNDILDNPFLAFATTAFNTKGFYVYSGKLNNVLVYIGTTTQIPSDRFRWHKANGKDLEFEVLHVCKDENEMLDKEFELIKKLKPKMNKIMHRKQNLNVKLTPDILNLRKGDKQWCQSCLKRRVNIGYSKCYYCSK